jgi:DNA-binding CsgD family transcriptional regulator
MSDSHLTRPLCELAEESAGLISQLCELMIREWTRSEWEQGKPLATFCHLASPGSSSLLEKTGLRVAAWAEQHKPAKERGAFVKRYTSLLELIGHFGTLVQPAAHPLSGPYFSPMRTSIAVLDDNQLRMATLAGAHLPETLRAWAAEMRQHAEAPAGVTHDGTQGGQAGKPNRSRRRRRKTDAAPRPMTAKQTEAVQIVGECKGNFSEAARRLGVSPKTVREHYQAGLRKLGRKAVKHATQRLPSDRRGQDSISSDDDRRRG